MVSKVELILVIITTAAVITGALGYSIHAEKTHSSSSHSSSSHTGRILKKQLSDEDHFKDLDHDGVAEAHNRDFDHEAFLGSADEADEFDALSPEESKRRLGAIVARIDADADGNVTEAELKAWITAAQRRYLLEDVDRQWEANTDRDPAVTAISWSSFRNRTYGFLDEIAGSRAPDDLKTYTEMLKRDERRWAQADVDGDGALNRAEFTLFLHPEEDGRMHSVVVEETLEDVDRDGDGRISEQEYIADMYAPEDEHSQYVPEWVAREREQFRTYRDQDGDGYLDRGEIRQWIVPTDYDHAGAEAKHLLQEADGNGDGLLSKEEILANYDVFVGSQATDFGDALTRHDEF